MFALEIIYKIVLFVEQFYYVFQLRLSTKRMYGGKCCIPNSNNMNILAKKTCDNMENMW